LQFLGTFALWFGWYGFNPGSSLTVASTNRGNVAALAAINTTIAAASGGLSALFTQHFLDRWKTGLHMYDTTVTMNGVLTGLVAITAPCGSVYPWAAYVIGIVAGWLYLLGSKLLVRFRIDDPADAVPVHMVGGAWGMIATGLFSPRHLLNEAYGRSIHEGWFYAWGNGSGDFTVLGIQLLAVIWIFGWVFVVFGLFTWSLHSLGMLRVNAYTEEVGMDISAHKGAAYGGPDSDNIIVSMEKLFQRAGSSFLSLLNIKVDNVEDTKLDQRPALLEKARSTESKLDVDHIGDII
jgi:Amt family ammonium transporter